MKVLFVEGKNPEPLRRLARQHPYPYRLLYRAEQELYLLEVWAYDPELEAKAVGLEGFRSWSFELMEEGQRHP
ncbi:hypothetical protein [Meiothermus taiwanensis]|jgi:hypothetical protein|uniref:Uncharacterized protein n=2 Tax=Meiothermus taiwanensis TaxID=172827 RepID=A0A399E6M4_9DEIN|nr:hypothetical protein [Meiothermus taiwanensis]AWR86671.1 hypothetical protein Mtai_v1c14290 [Meiothermus taiwanensis WR-220]KIQ54841.1 hypothetical protein SY28_06465 [Meiothermus taiwanensis]KZK16028.1 hypothetical protein A3962_00960 [Meiothermus taiwanensis]RIH78400.1 hypothetical protein Mcate_00857 [Meiothermus taiwanensis]